MQSVSGLICSKADYVIQRNRLRNYRPMNYKTPTIQYFAICWIKKHRLVLHVGECKLPLRGLTLSVMLLRENRGCSNDATGGRD